MSDYSHQRRLRERAPHQSRRVKPAKRRERPARERPARGKPARGREKPARRGREKPARKGREKPARRSPPLGTPRLVANFHNIAIV